MKKIFIIALMAITTNVFSQEWPVNKMVSDKKAKLSPFAPIPAFKLSATKKMNGLGTYQELKLDPVFSQRLLLEKPATLQIDIPVSNSETITCNLVRFELGNIKFTQNNKDEIQHVKIPVLYRGVVSGELKKNNVMLTVNENYLSIIASFTNKAIQITKADETDKATYRLYNSDKIQFPSISLDCGTVAKGSSSTANGILLNGSIQKAAAAPDKCVNVFVDCFDSLYQWNGNNAQKTIDYVYELFNGVATGYANEQINVQISTINVWTTPDPYRGDTRENALADLAANYQDNFFGNICVGLDYSISAPIKRSGLASSIGRAKGLMPGICPSYTVADNPFCYNDLNYTSIAANVKNFSTGPNTTGAAVYLVMHEMGHLLGSRHTKWCGWKLTTNPDTYGALDSCGVMEAVDNSTPVCSPGPPPPATGATIMSYCVGNWTPNDFVDLNNGFGTLPGNAIRNFISQTACIPSCLACIGLLNSPNNNNTLALHITSPAQEAKNKNNQNGESGNRLSGIKQPEEGIAPDYFQNNKQ